MKTIQNEFLIIGSGIAGLSFALKAAEHGSVAIITKKEKAESNTNYAQGGIAAVFSPDDSIKYHLKDTLSAGAGLCHPEAVQLLVEQGPNRIKELIDWGVEFSKSSDNSFDLGREGGHSKNRIIHAKDYTGSAVESALLSATKRHPNIRIYENHSAIELITEHHLRQRSIPAGSLLHCWGAYVLNEEERQIITFLAKATILATGGCGQVYYHTTNPRIATGDGVAMSYRAGAVIANMEFMQFHPTTLYHPQAESFLISEAVRGFGGILRLGDGSSFMEKYHPMASLAPRDIVAQAIDAELKIRGEECVYLDITHIDSDAVKARFPRIYEKCLSFNIDITKHPIPVVPAAHYACGGVQSDIKGRTSIIGLYAFGEVAHTGVHGANRLASNSLLEALVFSHEAICDAKNFVKTVTAFPDIAEWDDSGTFNHEEWILISHDKIEIQQLMWDYVGIVRSNLRLNRALRRIKLIINEIERFYKKTKITQGLLELRNLAYVAMLIIESALRRKESRGLHYTTDYPHRNDRYWLKDTIVVRNSQKTGE
ncbi:L-aspartate oxidase [candidate division KSB1 bacterium]|nr:L-aspartate oxidase [candidate division KSB1 bacterium]